MKIDIRWLLLAILAFVAAILFLQFKCFVNLNAPQPPPRILTDTTMESVFPYEYEGKKETAFLLKQDGKRYIVTSKRMMGAVPKNAKVQITLRQKGEAKPVEATVVGHAIEGVDITVLMSNTELLPNNALAYTLGERVYPGGDAYCLGFPCGGYAYAAGTPSIPWVKRATLSSCHNFGGIQTILLDGMSNPGYSGCPVLVYDYEKGEPVVAAVVSNTPFAKMPVRDSSNGTASSTQYVESSSGFFSAFAIKYAIDTIKANPIGDPLASK